ncbi:MAG: 3D domain-containing protein [Acutalibacteraceae bacterium]
MKRIHIYILLLFIAFFTGAGVTACAMRGIYVDALKTATEATEAAITADQTTPRAVEVVAAAEVTTPAPVEDIRQPVCVEVIATGYCPCMQCCGKTDGITATGTQATAGRTIAVDPAVIPYGTEVVINGHTYVAEDCGGAINGYDIDIFFNTHDEALQFGRQTLTAYYYD